MVAFKSKREKFQEFFENRLLRSLRANCSTWECRILGHSPGWNWVKIETFEANLWIGIGFTGKKRLRIDLHIGENIQTRYPHLYQQLWLRRAVIEKSLGLSLEFTPPEGSRKPDRLKAAQVEIDRPGTIDDALTDSNDILEWIARNAINFRSVFTPHIRELIS